MFPQINLALANEEEIPSRKGGVSTRLIQKYKGLNIDSFLCSSKRRNKKIDKPRFFIRKICPKGRLIKSQKDLITHAEVIP